MKEIIPNGTEVLVFIDNKNYNQKLSEIDFVKGKIISSKESDDLSYHGSPWYEQIYTVLGEDGKEYKATHRMAVINNTFIRTIEDHIGYIKLAMKENLKKIDDLKNKNNLLYDTMNELINYNREKEDKQNFEVLAVPCDRAFVVSPEKTEEFLNSKPNLEIRKQQEEMAKLFKVNNLVDEGPILKKVMDKEIKFK